MNVLIDARLLSRKKTGIGIYLENLIQSYIEEEAYQKITLLVEDKSQVPINFKINERFQTKSTSCKTFIIWDILILSFKLYFGKYDIIHFPTYIGVLFKNKNIKVLNTVHDIYYHLIPGYFSKNKIVDWVKRSYFDVLIKGSLNISDHIYSVSKTTATDLKRVFGIKSRITFNGYNRKNSTKINSKIIEYPFEPNSFYLYVGNLRSNKNIKFLLECFKNYSYHQLLIAGNYDTIPFKSIPTNVQFIGYQDEHSLKWLYRNARAFIFPSLYEGFGLPILEALSNHTVVFSSNSGSLTEFKNPNIKFFNPTIKEELIELLNKDVEFDHQFNEDNFFMSYNWHKNLKIIHETNFKK